MESQIFLMEYLDIAHKARTNNLFNYSKLKRESKDYRLPSPSGPLSKKVLPSMIQAANGVMAQAMV